jgi:predicted glycogen debranching enzyme
MTTIPPPLRVGWRRGDGADALLAREWLVTNGLGGYACGTLAGVPTRRFHGLLVAALPAPLGRTMMLNHLADSIRTADGTVLRMSGRELLRPEGTLELPGAFLREFRLENGRPVWVYDNGGDGDGDGAGATLSIEKRIVMLHQQNTVQVTYRRSPTGGDTAPAVTLILRPGLQLRRHEGALDQRISPYPITPRPHGLEIRDPADRDMPVLRLSARAPDARPLIERPETFEYLYRVEQGRGYDFHGPLFSPGLFEIPLGPGQEATFIMSTDSWDEIDALPPAEALQLDAERRARLILQANPALRTGVGAELVLAADQFIITPHTRVADEARLHAEGDDARTVIAGYHWFTDWGRDTMISLEGLTLATGRHNEARAILQTFAHHIRDGLIPNMFPEGESEGLYHTADATLWFFHALDRYEQISGDAQTRRFLLPKLVDIIEKHIVGTRFGIGVDPADGLLRQGADGYQLTWMDAKVDGWVVTPRRGKAVELNALFYNALCVLERWLREAEGQTPDAVGDGDGGGGGGDDAVITVAGVPAPLPLALRADDVAARAVALKASFNRRFWYADGGYLYDVVDAESGGDDASLRPNQIFAISLPHPVLEPIHWRPVLGTVAERLLTPFGLRSLAPGHPDYKPTYDGDLRSRDAAYHQGTVWGWLLGPFVDAWLKVFPDDRAAAHRLVEGIAPTLSRACIGTLSEIFDAESPFAPRGCVAQAWSVAEALRCALLTSER